jgi:hypothetical protein
MKKLLSLLLLFGCFMSVAQHSPVYVQKRIPSTVSSMVEKFDPVVYATDLMPLQNPGNLSNTRLDSGLPEAVIGTTTYDLQSNGSVQNRIINHPDATLSAAWTFSLSGTLASPDRGTGYNYFNNTQWSTLPSAKIESVLRTGWPSLASGTTNQELIVNHTFTIGVPLNVISRNNKGTGPWTSNTIPLVSTGESTFWPRACIGGVNNNTVHAISLSAPTGNGGTIYKGMDGAVLYSRSQDGGLTWNKTHESVPGLDSSTFFGFRADAYAIDSRLDVVAFVVGGISNETALFKSIDNGNTWTKKVVMPFPIAAFNPATTNLDTTFTDDGSLAVLIDNNGTVHVWAGLMRALSDTVNGLRFFPGTDGLFYWNETFGTNPPVVIAEAEDRDLNGTITIEASIARYGLSGLTSMPSAGINAGGRMFVTYSSIVENTSNGLATPQSYRNLYAMSSGDQGVTWTKPVNISNSDFDEAVYGSLSRHIDSKVHVVYQRDPEPGLAVQGDMDPFGINEIVYLNLPVNAITSIASNAYSAQKINLYPNPATKNIWISFEPNKSELSVIEIYNVLGILQFRKVVNALEISGNRIEISLENIPAGIYLIKHSVGTHQMTGRLIRR